MKEENKAQLKQQYEQALKMRNDITIVEGFTFNTLVGDIRIKNPQKALLMLDYYIKELQDEIRKMEE